MKIVINYFIINLILKTELEKKIVTPCFLKVPHTMIFNFLQTNNTKLLLPVSNKNKFTNPNKREISFLI